MAEQGTRGKVQITFPIDMIVRTDGREVLHRMLDKKLDQMAEKYITETVTVSVEGGEYEPGVIIRRLASSGVEKPEDVLRADAASEIGTQFGLAG